MFEFSSVRKIIARERKHGVNGISLLNCQLDYNKNDGIFEKKL